MKVNFSIKYSGPIKKPIRMPVAECDLLKPPMSNSWSRISSYSAKEVCVPVNVFSAYISSLIINISLVFK